MSDLKDLQITITRPYETVRGKGINSTTYTECVTTVRIPLPELELIDKAAKACGISRNAFIRQCSVKVASKITK